VFLARTGRYYSHKDMVHRRSLVHKLWLRMLQNQSKVLKICWNNCNLSLLNKVIKHFNFLKGKERYITFIRNELAAVLLARTGQFHNYKGMARSRSLVQRLWLCMLHSQAKITEFCFYTDILSLLSRTE